MGGGVEGGQASGSGRRGGGGCVCTREMRTRLIGCLRVLKRSLEDYLWAVLNGTSELQFG